MRRRFEQQIVTLSFKDKQLNIPGYKFGEARRWNDTGSSTLLATGFNLKDGSHVLAKIAPAHSDGAICLQREVFYNNKLSSLPEGTRVALSLLDVLTLPKNAGDCEVVIYLHPGTNVLGRYFPPGSVNDLLLPWQWHLQRHRHAYSHSQTNTGTVTGTVTAGHGTAGPGPGLPEPGPSATVAERRIEELRGRNKRNPYDLQVGDYDDEMDELTGFEDSTETGTEGEDTARTVRTGPDAALVNGSMRASIPRSLETTPPESSAVSSSASTPYPVMKPSGAERAAAMEVDDSTVPLRRSPADIPVSIPSQTTDTTTHRSPPDTLDPAADPDGLNTEAWDIMDLASFLEFAIHSTHCLEILHKSGHIHREVRANAFHVNVHSGVVRFSHFGNRSESLERTGGPSSLVIQADSMPSSEQRKVKEAICYLAPEQTGMAETAAEDHRTDLYALGVLFWTLLVGHGTLPFEGSPVELLHQVVQQKPVEVHEIRRDVPVVLSTILTKLLAKSPDKRYNSAVGLKNDLMECQKRLNDSCASPDANIELIPPFEIGQHDMFLELTIPSALFGREKEINQIRSVIRGIVTSTESQVYSLGSGASIHQRLPQLQGSHAGTSSTSNASLAPSNISVGYSNGSMALSPPPLEDGGGFESKRASRIESSTATGSTSTLGTSNSDTQAPPTDTESSSETARRDEDMNYVSEGTSTHDMPSMASTSNPQIPSSSFSPINANARSSPFSPRQGLTNGNAGVPGMQSTSSINTVRMHHRHPSLSAASNSVTRSSASLAALSRSSRTAQAHAIVVSGPAGIGKSSLILSNQAWWRRQGLWGSAKMVKGEASPFTALLSCLSSVLRQLVMFQSDRLMFISLLKARLDEQISNVSLLYHEVPELRDLLAAYGMHLEEPKITISTEELGARFHSLVESVYSALADVKLLALFLDDLHFADKSTLDLIGSLADSKSRILILATCRNEDMAVMNRVRHVFSSRARTTWVELQPLDNNALGSLVSLTLQRPKEEIASLTRVVARVSNGNPFQARNLLLMVRRQSHIWFEWGTHSWQYNLEAIERSVHTQHLVSVPTDISFLVAHFKELTEETQTYLIWASLFGPTFKINDVVNTMDSDPTRADEGDMDDTDSKAASTTSHSEHEEEIVGIMPATRASMRGLQQALAEGWLIQRARDMCSFTHDKYRQAATHMASQLHDMTVMKMCLKIASYLMQEPERDVFRITEYCRQCIPLIREDPKRDEFIDCLVQAAESSAARGAHELALQAFKDARTLLGEGSWHEFHERTQELTLKLAELYGSQGNHDSSDQLIKETLLHVRKIEDRAHALRLRGRNKFVQKDFEGAYSDTIQALAIMGVKLPQTVTFAELDDMFDEIKAKLLDVGFDDIVNLPRAGNPRQDLIVSLMTDAATNAFWGPEARMADYIGLTIINMALRDGISPGSAVGFFWCLGGAAERRQLYRFCSDLGRLGLQIAYRFGNSSDKGRCEALYTATASGYSPEHLRSAITRTEDAIALGRSSGDRIYEGIAQCLSISHRLYCSEHLSELQMLAEEAVTDIRSWTVNSDTNAWAMAIFMTIRAMAGETSYRNADTAFDTDSWKEAHFLHKLHEESGNFDVVMNWYNSFKIAGLFSLGFYARAAELGFEVWNTRMKLPSYRHIRYGLFFHSLAMIQCLRHGSIPAMQQAKYMQQIQTNQEYITRWVSPSPVNNSAWHAIIDAEIASLTEDPNAFKLYDNAIKLAVNHDWAMEEAWALYLEGSHFLRCGVEGLGLELQGRGIARHRQWGAYGIVNYLSRNLPVVAVPLKRNIFSVDAGVQTEGIQMVEHTRNDNIEEERELSVHGGEDEASSLTAADLADILKWSQAIASDINLTSSLQRLTEIATECSMAKEAAFAMRAEDGEYSIITSCTPPQPCVVYEQPKSIRREGDPLKRAVLHHCLNTRVRIFVPDTSIEPRFVQEASQSVIRSIICIPFSNNRGQTYGALFVGSQYPFSQTNLSMLSLLCQQASISIANALLFRSVQQATKANLQMIQTQKQALEEARKSREDAMKATKIKSNFLASMSHELRTPFSSFYGLLDILGGTSLNPEQRELVQTAKQSCELLLKIIDSILDYSKLEASALKLEPLPFLVEDLVADCIELLLPLAAQKLDLSYDIASDVPTWALGDYSRIRQILMNLLGNALKFTERGSVSAVCSLDHTIPCEEGWVVLKWIVQDTGIGMSEADKKNLWQPFSQADNSSTRRFGGTGLGLSISLSLVKLMGGGIGVNSQPGIGSQFWFHIPVQIHRSKETKKADADLANLRDELTKLQPLRILISSPSKTTLSLLSNILSSFHLMTVSSAELDITQLHQLAERSGSYFDFLILDDYSPESLEQLSGSLDKYPVFSKAKVIHLYTPTPLNVSKVAATILKSNGNQGLAVTGSNIDMALAAATGFSSTAKQDERPPHLNPVSFGRLIRVNKPPRRSRLLQLLANLKAIPVPDGGFTGSQIEQALKSLEAAQDALTNTANVLIAEDNPIGNKLLVKQLQKYDINVVTTSDGSEAIKEWEKRPIGYFHFALFDHHMPVCDGVEATKQIRAQEARKKAPVHLPIIALSADCQESTKELCLSAGMTTFLTKPVRAGDIPNLLKTYGTPRSR